MTQQELLWPLQYSWLSSPTNLRSLPALPRRLMHQRVPRVAIYCKQISVLSDDRLEIKLRCLWHLPRQLLQLHFQRPDRWEGTRLPWARSRLRDSPFRYLPHLQFFRRFAHHFLFEMRVSRQALRKALNGPGQRLKQCLVELPHLHLLLQDCLVSLRPASRGSVRNLQLSSELSPTPLLPAFQG